MPHPAKGLTPDRRPHQTIWFFDEVFDRTSCCVSNTIYLLHISKKWLRLRTIWVRKRIGFGASAHSNGSTTPPKTKKRFNLSTSNIVTKLWSITLRSNSTSRRSSSDSQQLSGPLKLKRLHATGTKRPLPKRGSTFPASGFGSSSSSHVLTDGSYGIYRLRLRLRTN
ncbi:hypothetical protein BHE74_00025366 [Ensete ventricosum]|nr:hypothetical protein BHE74_00025366 [Ensete ventricosum]RZS18271.1 hypothetical protein BHM03_00050491 [Ensete ventricosum]